MVEFTAKIIFASINVSLGWNFRNFCAKKLFLCSATEYLVIMSTFLCIKITDCNAEKFGYYQHLLIGSSFFCIVLLVVNGTRCMLPRNLTERYMLRKINFITGGYKVTGVLCHERGRKVEVLPHLK